MEFYSEARFGNWVKKIAETEMSEENPESFAVFDQMLEDVIIACLNILRAVKEREIRKADALREVEGIMNLLRNHDFGDELKNELFQFTLESIRAAVLSFKLYLEGKVSKKSFDVLLSDALKSERSGNLDESLNSIAMMGVKVLRGETLPELEVPDSSALISWLDGIDAISSVMELSKIDAPTEGSSGSSEE